MLPSCTGRMNAYVKQSVAHLFIGVFCFNSFILDYSLLCLFSCSLTYSIIFAVYLIHEFFIFFALSVYPHVFVFHVEFKRVNDMHAFLFLLLSLLFIDMHVLNHVYAFFSYNCITVFFPLSGKAELHGKVIEVDYSVPKKLR